MEQDLDQGRAAGEPSGKLASDAARDIAMPPSTVTRARSSTGRVDTMVAGADRAGPSANRSLQISRNWREAKMSKQRHTEGRLSRERVPRAR